MTMTNEQAALFAAITESAGRVYNNYDRSYTLRRANQLLAWLREASAPIRPPLREGIAYNMVLGRKAEFCGSVKDHPAHVNRMEGADLLTGGDETACPGYGSQRMSVKADI